LDDLELLQIRIFGEFRPATHDKLPRELGVNGHTTRFTSFYSWFRGESWCQAENYRNGD